MNITTTLIPCIQIIGNGQMFWIGIIIGIASVFIVFTLWSLITIRK